MYFNQAANLDLLAFRYLEEVFALGTYQSILLVFFSVLRATLVVLEAVLDHRDANDEQQG